MATGKSGVIQHTLYNDYYIAQHGYSYVNVHWQEEYDVATNSSVIKVTQITFSHSKYGGSWNVYGTVTIDGTAYSFSSTIGSGGVIANPITSNPIYHDDATGAKTINISTAVNTVGGSGGTQFYSGNHGTASVTVVLQTIPRLSEISTANGTLGVAQSLAITQKSTSYTHTIEYTCGSASGTICTKSSALSVSFTPSIDLARQNTSGTSVPVVLIITTYSGSTAIGSKSYTISCAIPANVVPSVSITTEDASGHLAEYGKYLQGKSAVKVKLTSAGVYGSTIEHSSVSFDDKTYNGSEITTEVIKGSGELILTATVRDTRGRTATASVKLAVYAYNNPVINNLSVVRCDANGNEDKTGSYFRATFDSVVTSLDGQNSAVYTLQYKKKDATEYTNQSLTNITGNYTVNGAMYVVSADIASGYDIIILVADDFISVPFYDSILSAQKWLSGRKNNQGAAFGKFAEEDDLLDVLWNIRGRKNLDIDGDANIDGALSVGDASVTGNLAIGGGVKFGEKTLAEIIAENSDPLRYMPVGYVYISLDSTSPAKLFGGTWQQRTDRFLVAAGNAYAAGATGGSLSVTLTEANLPSGSIIFSSSATSSGWSVGKWAPNGSADWYAMPKSQTSSTAVNSLENRPPYLAVYMWIRTA